MDPISLLNLCATVLQTAIVIKTIHIHISFRARVSREMSQGALSIRNVVDIEC